MFVEIAAVFLVVVIVGAAYCRSHSDPWLDMIHRDSLNSLKREDEMFFSTPPSSMPDRLEPTPEDMEKLWELMVKVCDEDDKRALAEARRLIAYYPRKGSKPRPKSDLPVTK